MNRVTKIIIGLLLSTHLFHSERSEAQDLSIESPQLLFHQDGKGNIVSGSIDALKQAIRNGKEIKLYMNLGFVEHSMEAGFTSIIGDKVYAQIAPITSQRPDKKEHEITLRPYSKHVGLYSTISPYEIKWFSY